MKHCSNFLSIFLASIFCLFLTPVRAQRIQQDLGRGVSVVRGASQSFISWRRLAQEDEQATYNVYVRTDGDFALLNQQPLSLTGMACADDLLPVGCQVAVTAIQNGVEGAMSVPFTLKSYDIRNIFVEIRYNGSPLNKADYSTKYVWPCDLDGDGEMDYVVDRNPLNGGTQKVEAYLRDGTFLWCVDMGPNESISNGQDDQVLAYDIDCDGLGEVVVQTSDGTRFWDKGNKTWGKYVNGGDSPDTDGDGIVDYGTQSVKNAPRYMTVIDGLSGAEQTSVEQIYNSAYNRTNKASLMGDEYNLHVGKVCVTYFDGIHPGVSMEWHTRSSGGTHYYYSEGFSYDFNQGVAENWHVVFQEPCGNGSFHSIRVADVDYDGKDEMLEGGWTMDHTGKVLFNAGISHGDRFRTTDIDPERPGMETFAIQQNAPDMLGQILYQAEDGKAIKKWYLSGVGDVGRGDCYDMDPNHLGWEMFSTMDGYAIYDAQGNALGKTAYFPTEALWWDGDLGREYAASPDGNGYNCDIRKWQAGSVTRLYEMAKASNYTVKSSYGVRALFWGDIIGDWREEIILRRDDSNGVCQGIVGFSTDYTTAVNDIYCLQEDPAYRLQCTSKGYYQTPAPSFYLGYDMPRPPLPPVMKTDLVWNGGYSDYRRADLELGLYAVEGKSVLFDLAGPDEVVLDEVYQPKTMYVMPPKGKSYHFSGAGYTAGDMELWKSQAGVMVSDIDFRHTGRTVISEGELKMNASISGPVELRARGTLSGKAVLLDTLVLEGALNYEGCRLLPGEIGQMDTIELKKSLNVSKRLFVEADICQTDSLCQSDLILVGGDLALNAPVIFSISPIGEAKPGRYKLMEYAGRCSGKGELSYTGLTGLYCTIVREDKAIWLVINEQRPAMSQVFWTGAAGNVWDYQSANFRIGTTATEFVSGDSLVFGDEAVLTSFRVDQPMPVGSVVFANDSKDYTIEGDGGFSGSGSLTFQGNGRVTMKTRKNSYTGPTNLTSGTLVVSDLMDNGMESSIGSGSRLNIGKATLVVNNSSASTNRTVVLSDTATIQVPSGTVSLKGQVSGTGMLVKTGGGQLNLTYSAANSYRGGTVIKGGTLAMGTSKATFGATGSNVYIQDNSTIVLFNNNSTSDVPNLNHKFILSQGKSLTVKMGQRCQLNGSLSGQGNVTVNFPYVRGEFRLDMSGFKGKLTATGNQFRLNQSTQMKNVEVVLSDDVYLAHFTAGSGTENNQTSYLGALSSSVGTSSLGTGTWNIGYLNSDFRFDGTFSSKATVHKYGSGTMKLTGASAAPITIHEGTVEANCSSAATTSRRITVQSGATLRGSGKTSSVNVESGGTLAFGSLINTGTLNLTGELNVSEGGRIELRLSKVLSDKLESNAAVNLTSPVFVLTRTGSAEAWTEGTRIQLISGNPTIQLTGTPSVEPEVPCEGCVWDWSELASAGVLKVVKATAVFTVKTDDVLENVYDMLGRKVAVYNRTRERFEGETPAAGVYLVGQRKMRIAY